MIAKVMIPIIFSTMLLCGSALAAQPKQPKIDDVNVVNTPDVNVINAPDVNVANVPDVVVANTPDVNVVNAHRTLVRATANESCGFSASVCQAVPFQVPTGKILVIEYIMVGTRLSPETPSASAAVTISSRWNGLPAQLQVGQTQRNGSGINRRDTFAGLTKLFVESDSEVRCILSVPNFQEAEFQNCTIVGYLQDM
jgi:hypothetical protein